MWIKGSSWMESHGTGEGGLLLQGDALLMSGRLLSEFASQVQCLYIDPPFYTGDVFQHRMRVGDEGWRTGRHQIILPAYNDRYPNKENYLAFMRDLLTLAHGLLRETGVFFLHIDYRMHAYLKILCDDIFGEKNLVNEIVWVYQTGGRAVKHFSRKHDILLFYKKSDDFFFDITQTPISRAENRENHMRRQVDEQGRTFRTIKANGKIYTYYEDEPAYPSDVWTDVSHLQQKDPQRTGYDTQKPMRLLERILLTTTKPGDLAADLCCGSGTTLAAAAKHGRHFLGVDVGVGAVSVTRKRLLDRDFMLEWPCAESEAQLIADVRPALGFYEVALKEYILEKDVAESLKKIPAGFSLGPLDAVDQWSAGYLKEGVFVSHSHAARLRHSPELDPVLEVPMLTGQLAIEVVDVLGRKSIWKYE
jgi:adenine specific DNA methylase Mod